MGVVFLLSAAALWGLIGPVSKIMFAHGITPLETAFWRGSLAGAAYLVHWMVARYPLPNQRRDVVKIILFGVFGVGLLEGSFVYAVQTGGAALASVLLYSAPIWVNLAGWFYFGERVPKNRWYALTLSFLGVAGLCLWGSEAAFTKQALIWGLLSGVSYAAFYIAGKVFFSRYNPVVVFMIAFPVGSLAIFPFMITASGTDPWQTVTNISRFSHEALIACFCLGIFSTYIPYLLYGAGLQRVHTGKASIIAMIEPMVSVTLAALMWGETFTLAGYFFAILIIMGVALS